MPLTSLEIKAAKSRDQAYRLTDGGGLYLLVTPKKSKLWRFDYRYDGRRNTLAIGRYPDVPLAEARDRHEAARKTLKAGLDPAPSKRTRKILAETAAARNFTQLAKRWFKVREDRWAEAYAFRIWNRIEGDILPQLGEKSPENVTADDILAALRRIEARGARETARRIRTYVEDIFKFAKSEGLVKANPAENIIDALATPLPPKRRAALRARDLPEFLQALSKYDGDEQTRLALSFVLLTFVRTTEIRFAQWDEFEGLDGNQPLWRIPAARMKMRNEHLVPLSPQAVEILTKLRSLRGKGVFVFPAYTATGVISENTMLYALYRMGYHSRATVHGFRGTASTILNERGFNRDWIERQLAHVERDEVRSAYNSAQWLPQRRKMMAWWANHLNSQHRRGAAAEHEDHASIARRGRTLRRRRPAIVAADGDVTTIPTTARRSSRSAAKRES